MKKLTAVEERAIADLKALAKRWPKTLWLYSAAGTLTVMRMGADGAPAMTGEPTSAAGQGVDPAYRVATIDIENDGGDW